MYLVILIGYQPFLHQLLTLEFILIIFGIEGIHGLSFNIKCWVTGYICRAMINTKLTHVFNKQNKQQRAQDWLLWHPMQLLLATDISERPYTDNLYWSKYHGLQSQMLFSGLKIHRSYEITVIDSLSQSSIFFNKAVSQECPSLKPDWEICISADTARPSIKSLG